MQSSNNLTKRLLLRLIGLGVCILPPAVAVFSYFPLWISRNDSSALSGFSLVLFFITLIPLYKYAARALKSPSAHTLWFISFAAFFILSSIADEMTVISFVGFISNLIGSLIFKAARKLDADGGKE